jgi:hypothetical protein
MRLTIKTDTERSAAGLAFCGAVLASMGVMVHEVYTVIFGRCLSSDPFTHVLIEMATFGSAGALAFAATGYIWGRLVARRCPQSEA